MNRMRIGSGIVFFIVFVCCSRISSAQDQISNFFKPILNSSSPVSSGSNSKEICDLSVFEIADGGWMANSGNSELRPVLLDFLWKQCGNNSSVRP